MKSGIRAGADERIAAILHHVAHELPSQGPIEVFIHHNTLHAHQALPFHEAIATVEEGQGVTGYLDEAEFRQCHARGRISDGDLEWALDQAGSWLAAPGLPAGIAERALWRALLFASPGAMSRDTLELLKSEGQWAARFDDAVAPEVRRRLTAEGVAWLSAALDDARAEGSLLPIARRLVGPRVEVIRAHLAARLALKAPAHAAREAEQEAVRRALLPLGLAPSFAAVEAALKERPEELAASALWGACVSLCGGADVLAKAPGDPVEHEAHALVNEVMIPLCAAFTDRGVARWTMPGREVGFFESFRALYAGGGSPLPVWLDGLDAELRGGHGGAGDATSTVAAELSAAGLGPEDWKGAVHEVLLRLPGWAGMFHRLEHDVRPDLPPVRLLDFLAVRLVLLRFARRFAGRELSGVHEAQPTLVRENVLGLHAAVQRLGLGAVTLAGLSGPEAAALIAAVSRFDRRARGRVWLEAYERHHEVEVLGALAAHGAPRAAAVREPKSPALQVVTCFDEREESYRRHFEDLCPEARTYGVAGFFGVAIEFLAMDDVAPAPLAPMGVVPAHAIVEAAHPEDAALAHRRKVQLTRLGRLSAFWQRLTRGVAGGGLASLAAGPAALVELGLRILAPRRTARMFGGVRKALLPEPRTVLTSPRESDETRSIDGRFLGFSFAEKAQRVAATLQNIGLTRDFAPLVFIVAHGSSSVNNPHRSAYDCGACGGRNGGPNARLFARMANRPEVRAALRLRGIDIPDGTWFVGALHDTCTDDVTFHDEPDLPAPRRAAFEQARATFEKVSDRSAHERCRRFASAPRDPSPRQAREHVQGRAVDYGQARPELGHATNAVCIVGRRRLTRGLFLDRRAFLISYDPSGDAEGAVLERILSAACPVGAGINLEYYFSRVDNERLGCGTKLPHNLVSYLGVMNGAASDLRTGLPKQMIEIHEPMRLLMVIEAETETLEGVVARQPVVRELALNEWVRIATISPSGRGTFVLRRGAFVPWDGPAAELPRVRGWREHYRGHDDFLPPATLFAAQSKEPSHGVA